MLKVSGPLGIVILQISSLPHFLATPCSMQCCRPGCVHVSMHTRSHVLRRKGRTTPMSLVGSGPPLDHSICFLFFCSFSLAPGPPLDHSIEQATVGCAIVREGRVEDRGLLLDNAELHPPGPIIQPHSLWGRGQQAGRGGYQAHAWSGCVQRSARGIGRQGEPGPCMHASAGAKSHTGGHGQQRTRSHEDTRSMWLPELEL